MLNLEETGLKFIDKTDSSENERILIKAIAEEFSNTCGPHEKTFLIQTDYCTNAFYAEVHMSAKKLITMATIDVPLDPEEQGDYRANRELVEDNNAFLKMKDDAKLATYSCAGWVRKNMQNAGFEIKDGPIVGTYSPGTIATLR